jgi:hypothetical protein
VSPPAAPIDHHHFRFTPADGDSSETPLLFRSMWPCGKPRLSLIPVRTELRYGCGLELGPEVDVATHGIFVPARKCAFRIDFSAELEMSTGKPGLTLLSTGSLGAFDIVLVGKAFDAVTLRFAGAFFVSRNGQKPKFDVAYSDYQIGPQLDFVQQLQSFLSPKDGSGFSLTFTREFPGGRGGRSSGERRLSRWFGPPQGWPGGRMVSVRTARIQACAASFLLTVWYS